MNNLDVKGRSTGSISIVEWTNSIEWGWADQDHQAHHDSNKELKVENYFCCQYFRKENTKSFMIFQISSVKLATDNNWFWLVCWWYLYIICCTTSCPLTTQLEHDCLQAWYEQFLTISGFSKIIFAFITSDKNLLTP